MPGECKFNNNWLQKSCYSSWLARDSDIHNAKCNLCVKKIDLKRMGESALSSHMKSKKHCDLMNSKECSSINRYTSDKAATSVISQSAIAGTQEAPKLVKNSAQPASWVQSTDTWKAEILHVLKTVVAHQSYKSCEVNSNLFSIMFPDSEIARSFSCGEKKTAYLVNHGLKPYFLKCLLDKVKTKDSYVLLFDESLNKKLQEKQLDMHIRYFDASTKQVQTYFLDSQFMGHGKASDLQQHFTLITEKFKLDLCNLLQISMDGPNVNLKFRNDFESSVLQEITEKKLLNIGTCSIHQVHNVFRAGFQGIDWEIESIIKSMYHLFKDSPARRDDFAVITGCEKFPLKYCPHRWVENTTVVNRALEVLPHVIKYVETVQSNKKYTTPSSKTYLQVKSACLDPLTPAKLNFFLVIANHMTPYLRKYQTDKPMVPFIADDVQQMMKDLMLRIVKKDVVEKLNTKQKVGNFRLKDSDTLACNKIDIGFVTEKLLKQAYMTKKITDRENLSFYADCKKCLTTMVKKLSEKNPLHFSLVRNSACLKPTRMVKVNLKETLCNEFKRVLTVISGTKRFDENKVDLTLRQYRQFLSETVSLNLSTFSSFKHRDDRLDEFFSGFLHSDESYKELWFIVRLILTLSHGQATVERGFSVNSKFTVENKTEDTYVAQRIIQDSVRHMGGIFDVEITKDMISYAKSARSRYALFLEEKKEKAKNEKRKKDEDELNDRKKKLKKDIEHLQKCAEQAAEETEKTVKRECILRFNAFRKSIKEKQEELQTLEEQGNS